MLTDSDPLEPLVEVLRPHGEVLLAHRDGPSGFGGEVAALLSKTASLGLSPVVSLAAHLGEPAPRAGERIVVNPLVAGGRRLLLLLLNATTSLALALLVYRRGASRPRALVWAAGVAVLGPFAALAAVLVEPPARAHVAIVTSRPSARLIDEVARS